MVEGFSSVSGTRGGRGVIFLCLRNGEKGEGKGNQESTVGGLSLVGIGAIVKH